MDPAESPGKWIAMAASRGDFHTTLTMTTLLFEFHAYVLFRVSAFRLTHLTYNKRVVVRFVLFGSVW